MRNAGQGGQNRCVQLAGIGLTRYRKAGIVAHLFRNAVIQLFAFFVIAVKQLQKARLGTGGTLAAQQPRAGQTVFHLVQIHQKLLCPQGGTLAHGGGLRRLEVGERQGGQILVFLDEMPQQRQHIHQLFAHQTQRIVHDHQIGVVADIAAGRAQMDDALGFRALHPVSVHMRHHIVAHLLFLFACHIVVDVVLMRFQLGNLLIGDGQAQLLLGFRQRDPQLAPCAELVVRRKQILHFLAGIAGGKGRFITVRHKQPPNR